MVQTATSLATVPFRGQELVAIESDGVVWVSSRRVCDNLAIDWKSQHRKLAKSPWARMVEMTTHDAVGRQQVMTMVDYESLPMWLATINPNKVRFELRDDLIAYQREAKQVLARHFFGISGKPVDKLAILREFTDDIIEMVAERVIPVLTARLHEVHAPNREPMHTVKTVLKDIGWLTANAKHRRQIRCLAQRALQLAGYPLPTPLDPAAPASELAYPHSHLAVLTDAAYRIWDEYKAQQAATPLPLFDNSQRPSVS